MFTETGLKYAITVDYYGNTTIKKMLESRPVGSVSRYFSDLYFPRARTGKEHTVVTLIKSISETSTAILYAELQKKGVRPINAPQLVALGLKYPDLYRLLPIGGLGEIGHDEDNRELVPWLDDPENSKVLSFDVDLLHRRVRANCHLAVVAD